MNGQRLMQVQIFASVHHPENKALLDDYIYVAFDSGDIYIVAVYSDHIEAHLYARISSDIGTSFLVIEGDESRADLVIVGGSLTSGGEFAVNSLRAHDDDPFIDQPKSEYSNWAPIFDCQVVPKTDFERDRLAVISGYKKNGSITQIRFGIAAQTVVTGPMMKK